MAKTAKKVNKYTKHVEVIRQYCRYFRKESGITLEKMAEMTGAQRLNLTAFENGNATAVEYIFYYYDVLPDVYKSALEKICFDCFDKDFYVETARDTHGNVAYISVVFKKDDTDIEE